MAPPRLLGLGFENEHRDGLVSLAANPYAAMPSLHAADALILGVVLAFVCRRSWAKALWIAWPAWVWFAVMATGNHFWLDCIAGMAVAVVALTVVYRRERPRRACRPPTLTARPPTPRSRRARTVVASPV